MKTVISYITKFLIGGEKADVLASLVGYTSDPNKFSRYRVVIIPSPFFRDEVYGTALPGIIFGAGCSRERMLGGKYYFSKWKVSDGHAM